MNFNKAFILGNLTRDPELRTLPSGQNVANFGVATNRYWRDREGNRKEDVQFHNIVVFGASADVAAKYLTKGSLVFIEGRIQNRSYEDKSGQKRFISEIVAEHLQLGPRRGAPAGEAGPAPATGAPAEKVPVVTEDEATPKSRVKGKAQKAKETTGPTGEKDDEFDIEEDIPF